MESKFKVGDRVRLTHLSVDSNTYARKYYYEKRPGDVISVGKETIDVQFGKDTTMHLRFCDVQKVEEK